MEITQGQIWRYQTRPGEENSLVIVGKVDNSGVHFSLIGLNVKVYDPRGTGKMLRCPFMGHICLMKTAFLDSVIDMLDLKDDMNLKNVETVMQESKLKSSADIMRMFCEGFKAFQTGTGKVFDKTIAGVVEDLEQAMLSPDRKVRRFVENEAAKRQM